MVKSDAQNTVNFWEVRHGKVAENESRTKYI